MEFRDGYFVYKLKREPPIEERLGPEVMAAIRRAQARDLKEWLEKRKHQSAE
jgi:hypothetical protein